MLGRTWPLFRAFRVEVRASWTAPFWWIFFTWQFWTTWELPLGVAAAWGVAWTAGLFVTVWTHEMGHIWAGRRCGIDTERITLSGLGGLAHLDAPATNPKDEISIALAGPAVHLLWLAGLWPAVLLLEDAHAHDTWFWMLDGFRWLQVALMAFNLLPVYPLDGGRVLRGALAHRMHANRASLVTANLGFVGNGLFILQGLVAWLGIWEPIWIGRSGFVLVLIGIVGIQACRNLRLQARHGEIYGPPDPFAKTLLESQAAVREMEEEERKVRSARNAARERRRKIQETADRLLDRINEVGGIEGLTARERKDLEAASRALREEPEPD